MRDRCKRCGSGWRRFGSRLSRALLFLLLACSCAPRAEVLGVFGESRHREVLGQDGVTPIPFDASTTIWTFGDTIIGSWKGEVSASATFSERADPTRMISNSLAFTERLTEANIGTLAFTFYKERGLPAPFIRNAPGEDPSRLRLWALDGVRFGNRVYVYYLRIRIDDPRRLFAFTLLSVGLARWDVPAGWRVGDPVSFTRLPDLFSGAYPAFGACVVERDGMLYLVGQRADGMKSSVWIARAHPAEIERGSAYRFLTADGAWTPDIGKSGAFLGDVMGECSLSYHPRRGGYLIVYCQQFANAVRVAQFKEFSDIASMRARTILALPSPVSASGQEGWYYSGKEIFSDGDRIYAVIMHPVEYRPYLLRIRM